MAGQIKVNYGVMDQIIGDIHSLAALTRSYGKKPAGLGRSKGDTAGSLQTSAQDVARFALALADVMEDTAKRLAAAEEEMKATDEGLATQYDGTGSTSSTGGGSGSTTRGASDSNKTPKDVRLGDRAAQEDRTAKRGNSGGGRSSGGGRRDSSGGGGGKRFGSGGGSSSGGGRRDGYGGSSGGGGASRSFGPDGGGGGSSW